MPRALLAAALVLTSVPVAAESLAVHKVVDPATIQWAAAPPALPAGAKAAVLYGDPAKEGLFVMRIWMPKGYSIAPHTHPRPEIVTILSGKLNLAMGSDGDRRKAHGLGAGSFSAMQPNTPHFAFTNEETVIQISTTGPWGLTYLNPADDPRNKGK